MKLQQLAFLTLLALPTLTLSLPACGNKDTKESGASSANTGPTVTDEDRKLAKAQFQGYCVACHGESGKGDGPAGVALTPRPRNWTDVKWQDSVTDEHLRKVIKEGGAAVNLSPLMAPNPQYGDRPGVIAALAEIVRSFKGK